MKAKKKFWKKTTAGIYRILPEPIRAWILRKLFPLNYTIPQEMTFQIAQTQDDYEQAFHILYESYLELGYISPNDSQIRVTKYHAVPGTVVMIVKWKEEVIATMSIIPSSPLKLPLESTWNIDSLKQSGVVAEISALSVKKEYRKQQGKILLPLCNYMYRLCTEYLGIDIIVISTLASVKDFYRLLLLFKPIETNNTTKSYGFVRVAKAVAQYLDYRVARTEYEKVYNHKEDKYNVYGYFTKVHFTNFKFPEKKNYKCDYTIMTPTLLEYFFNQKTSVYFELERKEKGIFQSFFPFDAFKPFFKKTGDMIDFDRRKSRNARHRLVCQASLIQAKSGRLSQVRLMNASWEGFQAEISDTLSSNDSVVLNVTVSPKKVLRVKAKVVWVEGHRAGFEILSKASPQWSDLISDLESIFLKAA